MNFVAFPVGATNIFPLANSSAGGQLMSEMNLRSRESVGTTSSVKYFIGPSFTHSQDDYSVYCQKDGYDTTISNTTIQIQPGRALVNGHYVELLTPINIDINDANYLAQKEGIPALKGKLAVGLKMAYSTYQTLAGSALVENKDDYYEGVQVVIVPADSVKLPKDVPGETQFTKVNMHLLLATFNFRNGVVTSVTQNEAKIQNVEAERIANIEDLLSDTYISKAKLDPNKLYAFSGKSSDGETIDGRDTWCDATDSLMIWDKTPTISTVRPSSESYFKYDSVTGNTYLVVAHKQVDAMVNTGGQSVYYQDKTIQLPSADFEASTGGVVSPKYTKRIKDIRDKVDLFYRIPNGRMRNYMPVLNDREALPEIPMTGGSYVWETGDYVVVGQDYTVGADIYGRYPSTMYIVGPGYIQSAEYVTSIVTTISTPPVVTPKAYNEAKEAMMLAAPESLAGGVMIASEEVSDPTEASIDLWNLSDYRGTPRLDFFVARYCERDTEASTEKWTCYYYTPTRVKPGLAYYDPVWITGGVPLATEESVGGFVNVPANQYGAGYVRLNDDGYLQLVDYDLLLTGVLAYQLGQDYSEGAGLAPEELQSILEENINDRVCFPNAIQIENATKAEVDPNVINLYLELPETPGDIVIHDIGSRYGSSLFVHIHGAATSATSITFKNCDKLRIDGNIEGAPTIYLDNVHLYYDSEVLDACASIADMTLWYERFEDTDPDLQVDGMTVTLLGMIESTDSIDPWDSEYANDNHYAYALRSLTFGNDGSIINVGLLVGDSTTANIDEGKSVFAAEFTLPQSIGLNYPATRMTHRIKISGSFVSHYYITSEAAYMMKHTDFSAITQKYNPITRRNEVGGTISFYTDATIVDHINGVTPTTTIDGWDLNTPHFFTGGVIE